MFSCCCFCNNKDTSSDYGGVDLNATFPLNCTLILLGLDNAGKSTVLQNLLGGILCRGGHATL